MWYTYVLYSKSSGKSYVGFTNDIERRLFEHNVSETKGPTEKMFLPFPVNASLPPYQPIGFSSFIPKKVRFHSKNHQF
mgnify:CR=1 FL=1